MDKGEKGLDHMGFFMYPLGRWTVVEIHASRGLLMYLL